MEVTLLLFLSVGRTVFQLPSLLAPFSPLLVTTLSLLITQTQMVPAKGTSTFKSVKMFDAQLSEHCIWWCTWILKICVIYINCGGLSLLDHIRVWPRLEMHYLILNRRLTLLNWVWSIKRSIKVDHDIDRPICKDRYM